MNLKGSRIILTGAAGGIGQQLALALARTGARLLLVDRNLAALKDLSDLIRDSGGHAHVFAADLTRAADREAALQSACTHLGGVDVLINNAGVLDFTPYEEEDPAAIEKLLQVNLVAPLLLTRVVLPALLKQGSGRIVNMGSTFGSIAFPFFASYSASKFGLRGFSQALRRELAGTGVGVTYLSPRATKTALNTSAVTRMNDALKVAMDPPEVVAQALVQALANDRDEVYLGWPEKLFVRINALFPRLVDSSLRKQHAVMRQHALEG